MFLVRSCFAVLGSNEEELGSSRAANKRFRGIKLDSITGIEETSSILRLSLKCLSI
jgi:hypothetical protein